MREQGTTQPGVTNREERAKVSIEPMADLAYYRDPVTERWLDTWPLLTTELKEIRLSQIDMKSSRDYQNRISSHVDEDHVCVIAEALKDPDATVPPIVVRLMGDGRLIIGDGNHRAVGAQRADRETLLAYVVTCDDKTFHQMAIAANARNALSLTPAERAVLIAKMQGQGVSQATIAAQWGLTKSRVSAIVRAEQGADLLREVGVAQPEHLTDKAREAAARLTAEDLRLIGTQVLKDIGGNEMDAAAREILDAQPSQRLSVAEDVGRRILKDRRDRNTPKGRQRAMTVGTTPTKVSNALSKVAAQLVERPELCQDEKVRKAMDELLAVWK